MPTPLSNSLQRLHAWPLQRRSFRHQGVLGTVSRSSRYFVRCGDPLHGSNTAQLLGLASAACLFMTSLPAYADEDITRSFNKNCIGDLTWSFTKPPSTPPLGSLCTLAAERHAASCASSVQSITSCEVQLDVLHTEAQPHLQCGSCWHAGCHVGGGNVVQAGATLKEADLQRNGAASVEAIYDLVYNGKGKMPGYGAGCAPKVWFPCRCSRMGAQVPEKSGGLVSLHPAGRLPRMSGYVLGCTTRRSACVQHDAHDQISETTCVLCSPWLPLYLSSQRVPDHANSPWCRGSAHLGRGCQTMRFSDCPNTLYSRQRQAGDNDQVMIQRQHRCPCQAVPAHIAKQPRMVSAFAY